MNTLSLAAFNLLLNGIAAFALTALFAWGTIRVLRIPPGRAQLALAALPFAKLACDLASGIPDRAFLWQRAAGVPRDLGVFQIGVGTRWGLLRLDLSLGALAGGTQYPDSAADIFAGLLARRVSLWAPLSIAALLLLVSAWRIFERSRDWLRAARDARALRRTPPVAHASWRGRSIPIYLLDTGTSSPFSGGLLRRYICFPRALWHTLPGDERAAAVDHELAHVVERHLVVLLLAGVIEDLFWFVPGMASARRRLSDAIEGAADQWAVDRGHSPVALASALVRVAETASTARLAHGICGANGASARVRIGRLLSERLRPRLGCRHPLARGLVVVWMAGSLLTAITFGNH